MRVLKFKSVQMVNMETKSLAFKRNSNILYRFKTAFRLKGILLLFHSEEIRGKLKYENKNMKIKIFHTYKWFQEEKK